MDYADYQKYSGREVQEDENMNYLRKGKGISLSMNKVIIGVDRDGTLIVDPGYYGSQANWRDSFRIVPYAIEGLSLLSGFFPNSYIIVFSNQSGPAQEIVKEETVYEINNLLKRTFYKDNIHIELFMNSFKISIEVEFLISPVSGYPLKAKPHIRTFEFLGSLLINLSSFITLSNVY